MDQDDVVATLAIKALAKEMRLRRIVSQPVYACWGGVRGILRVVSCVFAMGGMFWMIKERMVPSWSIFLFTLSFFAMASFVSLQERFNALVELMEIEKERASNDQKGA